MRNETELYNKNNKRITVGYNFCRCLIGGEVDIFNGAYLFFFGPFFIYYQNDNKNWYFQ